MSDRENQNETSNSGLLSSKKQQSKTSQILPNINQRTPVGKIIDFDNDEDHSEAQNISADISANPPSQIGHVPEPQADALTLTQRGSVMLQDFKSFV